MIRIRCINQLTDFKGSVLIKFFENFLKYSFLGGVGEGVLISWDEVGG